MPRQRVITNSLIGFNMTIHLYFLDFKFQLLNICYFDFSQKKPLRFFGSGPIWAHFGIFFLGGGGGGGNDSYKQRLIELKFWPQVVFIVVQMPFKVFWRTQFFTVTGVTKILVLVKLWPIFVPWRWQKPKIAIGLF